MLHSATYLECVVSYISLLGRDGDAFAVTGAARGEERQSIIRRCACSTVNKVRGYHESCASFASLAVDDSDV